MKGKRVEDGRWDLKPGEYSKHICTSGDDPTTYVCWLVYPPLPPGPVMIGPNPHFGGWDVDEHEDGTISLQPKPGNSNSLLVHSRVWAKGQPNERTDPGWHGYINHGEWVGA